ncbi:MAG: hypothetical protein ACTSPF_04605 [Candidatus Heimdallarchaeaceae archaeon]
MATENIEAEDGEVWKDWFLAVIRAIWKKIHSPLGILVISIWFVSVFTMGLTNTFRGGSFWEGPSYWINIFLTYGLNTGQDATLRLIAKPVFVWFFAPIMVLLLGVSLFLLSDSGFFLTSSEQAFDPSRYFSIQDIWGSQIVNPDKPKFTGTYLWLVIMPLILGAIISAIYNFIMFKIIKKKKHIPSAKTFLMLVVLFALIIGIEMALMTGELVLEFKRLFYSLFVDRRDNQFLIYGLEHGGEGQYHPIAVTLTVWLLFLVPFFAIYLILLIIGNLDNIWKNKNFLYRRIVKFIESRQEPELEQFITAEK